MSDVPSFSQGQSFCRNIEQQTFWASSLAAFVHIKGTLKIACLSRNCSEDHICTPGLSVALDSSNKTSLPKTRPVFFRMPKKLYPAEIIFMESQDITPESQELKYMAFGSLENRKQRIRIKSSIKWKWLKLKEKTISSVASEKKDDYSHHKIGL